MSKFQDRQDQIERRIRASGATPLPVLIVEDDDARVAAFERWLPPVFRLVHCRTGGAALGLLERSDPWDFPGVMLDFDLDKQLRIRPYVNGEKVLYSVSSRLDHSTNILVHSVNDSAASRMVADARETNPTTRIDYLQMNRKLFRAWLEDVWSESVDRHNMFIDHQSATLARRYACAIATEGLSDDDFTSPWSSPDEEFEEDEPAPVR